MGRIHVRYFLDTSFKSIVNQLQSHIWSSKPFIFRKMLNCVEKCIICIWSSMIIDHGKLFTYIFRNKWFETVAQPLFKPIAWLNKNGIDQSKATTKEGRGNSSKSWILLKCSVTVPYRKNLLRPCEKTLLWPVTYKTRAQSVKTLGKDRS